MVDLADATRGKVKQLNAPLGWTLAYIVSGFAVVPFQPSGMPALLYPPIAVGIAFLLRQGLGFWPMVAAADALVSLYQYGLGADALVVPACTVIEIAVAIRILRTRGTLALRDHRDMAWLILACGVGALSGAALGTVTLGMITEAAPSWSNALAWWAGDAASSIALLPPILVLSEGANRSRPATATWRRREQMAALAAAAAVAYLTFGKLPALPDAFQDALEPLIVAPALWAALRLDRRATCLSILVTAAALVLARWSNAWSAAAPTDLQTRMIEMQCYLVTLTMVTLPLSLVLDRERRLRGEAEAHVADFERTSRELSAISTRLIEAAKAGNIGVWDWNLDDNSVIWDQHVFKMYRIDPNVPDKYQAWLDRIHADDRKRLLAEIAAAVAAGKEVQSTFRVVLPDGDVRHFNTHGVIQAEPGGRAGRIIGIDYDVTELVRQRLLAEQSELRAAAANRAKSEFLSVMSHELRTPLNAIIGFSELIANETFGPMENERYKAYIGDIRSSGHMLLSLVNDILDLTRIESGKRDLIIEPIEPAEILGSMVRQLQPLVHAKDLQIAVAVGDGCPALQADRRSLRQILNNLVANSVKFTDPGGAITLSAAAAGAGRVRLTVTDTGRGIPRERIGDLCKPFVQIADSLRRDVGGLGLGLAISRALAETMNGTLSIESDLGQGTSVHVTLPALKAA